MPNCFKTKVNTEHLWQEAQLYSQAVSDILLVYIEMQMPKTDADFLWCLLPY